MMFSFSNGRSDFILNVCETALSSCSL